MTLKEFLLFFDEFNNNTKAEFDTQLLTFFNLTGDKLNMPLEHAIGSILCRIERMEDKLDRFLRAVEPTLERRVNQ